ncbi:MAG: NUDIX hydrolase [Thermodesulfobacteriota bacterium]
MTVTLNHRQTMSRGRVFDLVRDSITLQNGAHTDMDVIRHPGAAAIVAFPEPGQLLLVRQYRYPLDACIWEIPAGTLNPDEAPLACARRELEEETGYCAGTWETLGSITPVPAYSDERIHLFVATELKTGQQQLDADEILNARSVPWNKVMEMIPHGEIQDAKTISALFLAKLWLMDAPQTLSPSPG